MTDNSTICPKCGKAAWNPDRVARTGKNGQTYYYLRYRHRLDHRTKRNKVCYVKAEKPEST